MTINVLWIILASAIGSGTGDAIELGPATAQDDPIPTIECYRNGIWYNPCPPDPESPPPSEQQAPPEDLNPQ